MSTFREHRCQNCGVRYIYQPSGYGGLQPNNHADYCSDCYQVVQAALKAVPRRSEQVWIGTSDVTVADLTAQEKAAAEAAKVAGQLPIRRVLSPVFDLERPDNHHEQGIVSRNGRTYRYEYWTLQGGPEAGRVYIEAEQDTTTGKILGPWNLKDRWDPWPTFIEHPPWPSPPPPTHKFVPKPMPLPLRRFPMVESQSLPVESQPLPMSREYGPVSRNSFLVEPLPRGSLPIYDKDPDITAVVTGDADDNTE